MEKPAILKDVPVKPETLAEKVIRLEKENSELKALIPVIPVKVSRIGALTNVVLTNPTISTKEAVKKADSLYSSANGKDENYSEEKAEVIRVLKVFEALKVFDPKFVIPASLTGKA